jgi:hypothetical protein
MPAKRTLTLNAEERTYLETVQHRDKRPYMRVKATALLLVADGLSASAVTRAGPLMPKRKDTVCRWLDEFGKYGEVQPQPARRGVSP